jgi:spore maturation protein A
MAMAVLWTAMVVISVLCAAATGRLEALSAAALSGAAAAVELCIAMAGAVCLWCGVLEVLRRGGALEGLSRLLRPALGLLYPEFKNDRRVMEPLTANVAANLLGVGNAATPMGIRAASAMARNLNGVASDSLCMLVVINTASLQLIPATVAAARAAAGSAAPFDILPAVWLASAISVSAGILAARLFARVWP